MFILFLISLRASAHVWFKTARRTISHPASSSSLIWLTVACISDIHGNKLALDNVLADIKTNSADKIIVLGDLAMGGYDPNYTIEKLFSLENAEIIQGNTDKLIIDYNDTIYEKLHNTYAIMANALKLDDKVITKENKERLKNLSVKKTVEINGYKFELCHGSPRKQDENIYPDLKPELVEDMVKDSSADIILCGHTHIPCGYSLNSGKTVINVGSIGRSMTEDKMPVYLLITINKDGTLNFEHKKVFYDNKKVSEIISQRGFELDKEFAKLYI